MDEDRAAGLREEFAEAGLLYCQADPVCCRPGTKHLMMMCMTMMMTSSFGLWRRSNGIALQGDEDAEEALRWTEGPNPG